MRSHLLAALLLAACKTYDVSGTGEPADLEPYPDGETPQDSPDAGSKGPGRTPADAGGSVAQDAATGLQAPVLGTGALASAARPREGAKPGELVGAWEIERLYQGNTCGYVAWSNVEAVTWYVAQVGVEVNVVTDDPTLRSLSGMNTGFIPGSMATAFRLVSNDLSPDGALYTMELTLSEDVQSFQAIEYLTRPGCVVTRAVYGSRL